MSIEHGARAYEMALTVRHKGLCLSSKTPVIMNVLSQPHPTNTFSLFSAFLYWKMTDS